MHEVFLNPTVKKVIFQIKFPDLMYIENRIGDFQLSIIERFPESAELYATRVLFADIGPEGDIENVPGSEQKTNKIWQFSLPEKYTLNVLTSSLSIDTEYYKTYKAEGYDNKFRDVVEFVLAKFFKLIPIPIIKRVGLRYIDACPLPEPLTSEEFQNYYNTTFSLSRYPIENARKIEFRTTVNRNNQYITFFEKYECHQNSKSYTLDFDGFAENIKAADCLNITDELYSLISEEYKNIVKEPVKEFMRGEKGV